MIYIDLNTCEFHAVGEHSTSTLVVFDLLNKIVEGNLRLKDIVNPACLGENVHVRAKQLFIRLQGGAHLNKFRLELIAFDLFGGYFPGILQPLPEAAQPTSRNLQIQNLILDLDVVTANYYSYINESSVSILLNDGSGSLTLARAVDFPAVSIALDAPIPTGEQAFNVAIADLNDDGAPDIVTSSEKEQTGGSRISVILANP